MIAWFFFVLSNKLFFFQCSTQLLLDGVKKDWANCHFPLDCQGCLNPLSKLFDSCFKYTFHCSTGTWPENSTRIQHFISINKYISYILLYKNVLKVNGLNQQHMSYNCCPLGFQAQSFDYESSPVCNMPQAQVGIIFFLNSFCWYQDSVSHGIWDWSLSSLRIVD